MTMIMSLNFCHNEKTKLYFLDFESREVYNTFLKIIRVIKKQWQSSVMQEL